MPHMGGGGEGPAGQPAHVLCCHCVGIVMWLCVLVVTCDTTCDSGGIAPGVAVCLITVFDADQAVAAGQRMFAE